MAIPSQLPPLSLYVHIPWCVRKCPYCDFNSHQPSGELPVDAYVAALQADLREDAERARGRRLTSVFFGGGTPSLFPASAIGRILETAEDCIGFADRCEITLEANPGTAEFDHFSGYLQAGVNRLSMGVQSFDDGMLQRLGRIHSAQEAHRAFALAREAGFNNINLDLMFALPRQTPEQAMADLQTACELQPEHLSWYQLTIEPNTEFYSRPPTLPDDDCAWDIQQQGQVLLAARGYAGYEVSAYAQPGRQAAHNLNYWQFGDYLAAGAGSHGKITSDITHGHADVMRYQRTRLPRHYLDASARGLSTCADSSQVTAEQLAFEFMMNALRLHSGVPVEFFQQRTGLSIERISTVIRQQVDAGLLVDDPEKLQPTALGQQFLNSLLEAFLPGSG